MHGQEWKDWKYCVLVKVIIVNGHEEKPVKVVADVNLIQAAVIKQEIEQVKVITRAALAMEEGRTFLDEILNQEITCNVPSNWELSENCSWISG